MTTDAGSSADTTARFALVISAAADLDGITAESLREQYLPIRQD